MPHNLPLPTAPVYSSGDILVAALEDGSFQVSRVSGNGRSSHVMGIQRTQPAALTMAARATSGSQRVFLGPLPGETAHRLVE